MIHTVAYDYFFYCIYANNATEHICERCCVIEWEYCVNNADVKVFYKSEASNMYNV